MMERFTAWLSESERQAIRTAAAELNSSENYIVRSAIRSYLEPLLRVTPVTADTNQHDS